MVVFFILLFCVKKVKKKPEDYVTKIQRKNASAVNEYEISKKIKKINYYENYFAPIESQCNVDLKSLTIDPDDFNQCNIFKKENDSNFMSMQIKKFMVLI